MPVAVKGIQTRLPRGLDFTGKPVTFLQLFPGFFPGQSQTDSRI